MQDRFRKNEGRGYSASVAPAGRLIPMEVNSPQQRSFESEPVATPDSSQLLENPIWNALGTDHASIALRAPRARRYPAHIGPLSGVLDSSPESFAQLRNLTEPGGTVALFLPRAVEVPQGWSLVRDGQIDQMVLESSAASLHSGVARDDWAVRRLTASDAPAMVELAKLTEPGPFHLRTLELGYFVGAFRNDRLLAMAGQRMHIPRFIEVSAVCTHPSARGQGLARLLMSDVIRHILDQGATPILHTYAANTGAIRVYTDLGFVLSHSFELAFLKRLG